jgi:hypothetical protein
MRTIRRRTERGWPLAGDSARVKFEKALGCRVVLPRRDRLTKKTKGTTQLAMCF